jgi:S1-C subfamily serine protease
MGAQVAPLNSDLAQYFPVDQGVFVVQVVGGTPAAEAGLQGGDIIVGVDEEVVTSLSELRFGLAANPGPWTIHVVRKTGSVEIVIKG